MHIIVLGFAIYREAHAKIRHSGSRRSRLQNLAYLKSRLWALARQTASYATKRTYLVVSRDSYWLPNLIRVISISHGAVPSRGGQGRALLKQRFRPVSYGRFPLCPQGLRS
jgi:hypothetical protein